MARFKVPEGWKCTAQFFWKEESQIKGYPCIEKYGSAWHAYFGPVSLYGSPSKHRTAREAFAALGVEVK